MPILRPHVYFVTDASVVIFRFSVLSLEIRSAGKNVSEMTCFVSDRVGLKTLTKSIIVGIMYS